VLDLNLDSREPAKSAGHVDLRVKQAAINGGEVPVMGGALTVPKMSLGEVTAEGSVKDGKLTFGKLEARGQDLEATTDGLYLVLQPRLLIAPIFGKARLKVQEAFWAKGGMSARRALIEAALAQAKGKDGSYGFQIFGTLSQPKATMGL
jgi:type II secretion system protein N